MYLFSVFKTFSLFLGATIDLDDPPSQTNNKGRKVSRNGVHGGDNERSRVEVPKDGDQLKLTELFNVLRVKKPQETPQTQPEMQVRRVRSRHYSESDSDSSSNSDAEVRSCTTALSMTESELDTRRLESPRGIESPSYKMVVSEHESEVSRKSTSSDRLEPQTVHRNSSQPVPAPRSPKPQARRNLTPQSNDDGKPPVPKPRSPRPKRKNGDVNPYIKTTDTDADVQNLDSVSIHSNLSAHVARTKESLEIKYAEEKSKSQTSLNTDRFENEQIVRPKIRDYDKHRESAENLSSSNGRDKTRPKSEQLRTCDNHTESITNQNNKSSRTSENLSRSQNQNMQQDFTDARTAETAQSNIGDEFPAPRQGSPYSFSMDSLPSSHPSPTMRRVSFTSVPESSDTDSLSKASQKDASDNSGTESVPKENTDEDFVVEEISQVRFRRVSKGFIQPGPLAKLQQKSPNRSK